MIGWAIERKVLVNVSIFYVRREMRAVDDCRVHSTVKLFSLTGFDLLHAPISLNDINFDFRMEL